MERLSATSEILDGPLRDAAALEANLRDLAHLNRRFGAAALSARCLARLAPEGDPLTVLDVGTGAADIPADLIADARRRGRALTVTAVDNRPEVIEAALRIDPGLASLPGLTLDVADGAALPYPDGAFDVVHSSMVLHHLEPEPAVAFLRELRRVSRRGVNCAKSKGKRRPCVFTVSGTGTLAGVLPATGCAWHTQLQTAKKARVNRK